MRNCKTKANLFIIWDEFFYELDETIKFLNDYGNELSIMQCTTSYPTLPEQWGLNVIRELESRYNLSVGFSDHSGEILLVWQQQHWVQNFKFHVVFDKLMFGPDTSSSIPISKVQTLVEGANYIKRATQNPIKKNDVSNQNKIKTIFGKSLAVNKNLSSGSKINFEDLEAKSQQQRNFSKKL